MFTGQFVQVVIKTPTGKKETHFLPVSACAKGITALTQDGCAYPAEHDYLDFWSMMIEGHREFPLSTRGIPCDRKLVRNIPHPIFQGADGVGEITYFGISRIENIRDPDLLRQMRDYLEKSLPQVDKEAADDFGCFDPGWGSEQGDSF